MRTTSRPPLLIAGLTALALVALLPRIDLQAARARHGKAGAGGRAVAHHPGGVVVKNPSVTGRAPEARLYRVGHDALEPTLGVDDDGNIFFAGLENATTMWRSGDGGRSWEFVSPNLAGQNLHPISLDPYMWLDPTTGRLFQIDLTVACSYLSFSDDDGESWVTNPLACGLPANDHQTLFGGPPVTSPTAGYPNVLYYCVNQFAATTCAKSLDGGVNWIHTGEPVYSDSLPREGEPSEGSCHNLNGHGLVASDGTVFVPKEGCSQPWLWLSRDEGLTWQGTRVSKHTIQFFGMDPTVAVDAKGNLYYAYVTDTDGLLYLVTSRDDGETWSKPMMIAAPGLTETEMPAIAVGKPGHIALSYYGTDDARGAFPEREREDYQDVAWNGYLTMSTNALSGKPLFFTAPVNDPSDPFVRGMCSIARNRCDPVYDFIDVVIGPDGTPYGSYVDGCVGACVDGPANEGEEGVVGRLVGGPKLN